MSFFFFSSIHGTINSVKHFPEFYPPSLNKRKNSRKKLRSYFRVVRVSSTPKEGPGLKIIYYFMYFILCPAINQSINQTYLLGKYFKHLKNDQYKQKNIDHFPVSINLEILLFW